MIVMMLMMLNLRGQHPDVLRSIEIWRRRRWGVTNNLVKIPIIMMMTMMMDIKDMMMNMTKLGTGSVNTYFSGDTFHW